TGPANVDAVVVFSAEGVVGEGLPAMVAEADLTALKRLSAGGAATGKSKEMVFDLVEISGGKYRRIFSVGLGNADKITSETLRQAGARALRGLRKHRLGKATIICPTLANIGTADAGEAIATGALLAAFDFEEYKGTGQKKPDEPALKRLEWTIVAEDAPALRKGIDRARAIADGQNFARTIASRPANNINPPSLAKVAKQMAKEVGLGCRVLDEKELKKLGMGGILAVGAGAIDTPPRMIVLEYRGGSGDTGTRGRGEKKKDVGKAVAPLLIVGKSITFDTGGISIKPAEKMGKMIYDKCGGMAVLGLMYALAKLKLTVHVVGILSSAENAVDAMAYRPGDILHMYNGVTVDVTNTDAEGRLVLGDALAWGIETYKPAAVVDLATLTGGVVTALGKTMAGVMSNNDDLVRELTESGEAVGEKIWRLPLGEDQRDQIRGDHADIVNSAGREAHPLQGGAFLSFFVPTDGSVPWAHLDIAGVADTEKELPCYAKGATGWGVRTLVKWIEGRMGNSKAG
ncbi:MAG TPA: leucyl aminopeptidase, partial [Tepidisphaeraceae bacterium]|nr:leucyl aminopeptidase [Tepidisphaeraceae bacterium]